MRPEKEESDLAQYDLHVHTSWSDGSTSVEAVVKLAAAQGLSGLAISDHDTMEMVSRAKACADGLGLRVIPAAELSCIDPDTNRKVHLLAYAPGRPEALFSHFQVMADRRRETGEQIIELVCARYPVEARQILERSKESQTIYRVHILRALLELGYDNCIYGPLYQALFGKPNGSCLRAVQYPSVYEVAKAARKSQAAVVLAHPSVYRSFEVAGRLAKMGLLDGIEYRYPRKREQDAALHDQLVEEYQLITTGGTDFHGWHTTLPRPLGSCTTTEQELSQLLSCAQRDKTKGKEDNYNDV